MGGEEKMCRIRNKERKDNSFHLLILSDEKPEWVEGDLDLLIESLPFSYACHIEIMDIPSKLNSRRIKRLAKSISRQGYNLVVNFGVCPITKELTKELSSYGIKLKRLVRDEDGNPIGYW